MWEKLEVLSHMHAHVKGATEALMQQNVGLSQGLVTWMGWMALRGSVAGVEGQVVCFLLIPLP